MPVSSPTVRQNRKAKYFSTQTRLGARRLKKGKWHGTLRQTNRRASNVQTPVSSKRLAFSVQIKYVRIIDCDSLPTFPNTYVHYAFQITKD